MNIPKKENFIQFLIKAKQNSYAIEKNCILCRLPHSNNYLYEDEYFKYEDQYFGEHSDLGQEIVWHKNNPILGMSYRGTFNQDQIHLFKETIEFLKGALANPIPDMPVRGPYHFYVKKFYYYNLPEGDIFNFTGNEIIDHDSKKVTIRTYSGGLIKSKESSNISFI